MSYRLSLLRLQLSNLKATVTHQKWTIISNFDFDPLRVEFGPYGSFLTKRTQRTIIMCEVDGFLIGMKQFYMPYTDTQKSIYISTVKLLLVLSIF